MDNTCQWFLACTRVASGVVDHSVLGPVPTCRRCAEELELDLDTEQKEQI